MNLNDFFLKIGGSDSAEVWTDFLLDVYKLGIIKKKLTKKSDKKYLSAL